MDLGKLSPRSVRVLAPLALVAVAALVYVERGQRVVPSRWYDEMLAASQLAARAAAELREVRLERGVFVDPVNDPAETALIGQEYTQITTDRGDLEAKLASTDPNFAAVVVDMLRELGVGPGDCAALAFTGSFPALNLSTLAAVETLGLEVGLISSLGASNFGATDPYFTWLDMEVTLEEAGIFGTRSLAASLGGGDDIGRGLSPRGRTLLEDAISRSGTPLIEHDHLEGSIRERVDRYRDACGASGVAVYINVGGGVASLGHSLNGELIPNGPSQRLPLRNYPARGALLRLAADGVPVVQLLNIRSLKTRYGLEPSLVEVPAPGVGAVYGTTRYSIPRTLAVTLLLLVILLLLYLGDRRAHRLGEVPPSEPES